VATAGLLDLGDVPDWLQILVAGWPALAFLGGTLLVHTPAPTSEQPTTTADTVEPEPIEAVIERDDTAELEPEPAPTPALPAVEPESAPQPSPVPPAVAVPPALVAHAQKLATDHYARTGSPIDTDTLRARLGVPPVMADTIAAQLA
jgi:hypothetical protein